MGYGTGAIMACRATTQRDFEFARKFDLPIVQVVSRDGRLTTWRPRRPTEGIAVNPGDGRPDHGRIQDSHRPLAGRKGEGGRPTNYRLRDWLISRQRYWGAPIPIVHCPTCGEVPVPEAQLPVLLPDVENYQPSGTGESPLATIPEFVNTACPACGGPARRETDTMGGYACSSWYFLRFADSHNDRAFAAATAAITGCRWTCTPAASSMPAPTCSMPASGPRCCSTTGCWASRNRS